MGQAFTRQCSVAQPAGEGAGQEKLGPVAPEEPAEVATPPVQVCTRFTEVSCEASIPNYKQWAEQLAKGAFVEIPKLIQLGGLTVALRVYPEGDEDAAGGQVSVWFALSGERSAKLSATVSFTSPSGLVALTQSFASADLDHDTSLYGWTSFCSASDIDDAGLLADSGALHVSVSMKLCAKGGSGSCSQHAPDMSVRAAPDHVARLRSDLRAMRLQVDGDVVLVAEGKEHSAHQAVLKARSPVLRAMLEADMAERASGRVVIHDLDSTTVSLLLDFMYAADIPPAVAEMEDAPEVLGRLMRAADKYQVPNLVDLSAAWLERSLSTGTMLRVLEVAHELGNQPLKQASLRFVTQDAEMVQAAQDSKDFEALPPELVRELFVFAHGNNKRRQAGKLEFPCGTRWSQLSRAQLQRASDERGLPSLGEQEELLEQLDAWDGARPS